MAAARTAGTTRSDGKTNLNSYDCQGMTPLMQALKSPKAGVELVRLLIEHGANIHQESREVYGEPSSLMVLALAGGDPEPDEALLAVSADEYARGKARRFGTANPEERHEPFWEAMIRAGINAYQAARLFNRQIQGAGSPVWCAPRCRISPGLSMRYNFGSRSFPGVYLRFCGS